MRTIVAIETARLRMHRLTEADEALYCSLYADAETMRHIGRPLTITAARRSFGHAIAVRDADPESFYLAIVETSSGRPIGVCGIAAFDADATRAEVGILLKREARANGFGREALSALVNETFDVFAVDEVWVRSSPDDPAVARMNSRVGFTPGHRQAATESDFPKQVWSVTRASWKFNDSSVHKGEDRV